MILFLLAALAMFVAADEEVAEKIEVIGCVAEGGSIDDARDDAARTLVARRKGYAFSFAADPVPGVTLKDVASDAFAIALVAGEPTKDEVRHGLRRLTFAVEAPPIEGEPREASGAAEIEKFEDLVEARQAAMKAAAEEAVLEELRERYGRSLVRVPKGTIGRARLVEIAIEGTSRERYLVAGKWVVEADDPGEEGARRNLLIAVEELIDEQGRESSARIAWEIVGDQIKVGGGKRIPVGGGLRVAVVGNRFRVALAAERRTISVSGSRRQSIAAADGRRARIAVGSSASILRRRRFGRIETVEPEVITTGDILEVIPRILPDGKVRVDLYRRASRRLDDETDAVKAEEIATGVDVPDGGSIVIGGLTEVRTVRESSLDGARSMPTTRSVTLILTPRVMK